MTTLPSSRRTYERKPLADRFWEKVEKTATCWNWVGAGAPSYGRIRQGGKNEPYLSAHRFAYELAHGPIEGAWIVCHHCDNRQCVKTEPDEQWPDGHLFLGTYGDNMRDAAAKGRMASGRRHHNTKLSNDQVADARQRYASGESPSVLAQELGIAKTTLRVMLKGITWKHVGPGVDSRTRPNKNRKEIYG